MKWTLMQMCVYQVLFVGASDNRTVTVEHIRAVCANTTNATGRQTAVAHTHTPDLGRCARWAAAGNCVGATAGNRIIRDYQCPCECDVAFTYR
jgi:hypothetical protein